MIDRNFAATLLQTADPNLRLDSISSEELQNEAKELAMFAVEKLRNEVITLPIEIVQQLSERQLAQYQHQKRIVEEYGQWHQGNGANGASYVPDWKNPLKLEGIRCQGCLYYQEGKCSIVSGWVQADGVCRLWIIPDDRLMRNDSVSRSDGKVINWNGLSIGITHEPGMQRFAGGNPMRASYGRIYRSWGQAEDGKAIDVYLHPEFTATSQTPIYRVTQRHPETGEVDERKYFFGYSTPQEVKQSHVYHVGVERFGSVEKVNPADLDPYRKDATYHADSCGCKACSQKRKAKAEEEADDDEESGLDEDGEPLTRKDAAKRGLVKKKVKVQGKGGKTYESTRWVKPETAAAIGAGVLGAVAIGAGAIALSQAGKGNSGATAPAAEPPQPKQTKPEPESTPTPEPIETPQPKPSKPEPEPTIEPEIPTPTKPEAPPPEPEPAPTSAAKVEPEVSQPKQSPTPTKEELRQQYDADFSELTEKLTRSASTIKQISQYPSLRETPLPADYDSYDDYEKAVFGKIEASIAEGNELYERAATLTKEGVISRAEFRQLVKNLGKVEEQWEDYISGKSSRTLQDRVSSYKENFSNHQVVNQAGQQELNDIKTKWQPVLETDQFQKAYNGTKESDSVSYAGAVSYHAFANPNLFRGLRDNQGRLQAGAIVTEKDSYLLVNYLASAPHNLVQDHPDSAKGSGLLMIASLVEESVAKGKEGRLVLDGQSGTAMDFYRMIGFRNGVLEPDVAQDLLKTVKESLR